MDHLTNWQVGHTPTVEASPSHMALEQNKVKRKTDALSNLGLFIGEEVDMVDAFGYSQDPIATEFHKRIEKLGCSIEEVRLDIKWLRKSVKTMFKTM